MAYLFKHTPLQTNFAVNLTCLVPDRERRGRPARAARPEADALALPALPPRGRDQPARARARSSCRSASTSSKASRRSSTRSTRSSASSASPTARPTRPSKIMKRFELDAEQTDAILELKLYRLARLEILVIQNELKDKRSAHARRSTRCSADDAGRWRLVRERARGGAEEVRRRRAARPSSRPTRPSTRADAFIVDEDNVVIVSRDGWVKRQKEVKDLATTRLREGDAVLAAAGRQHARHRGVLHQLRRGLHRAASSTCRRPPATASRCRGCSSSRTASGWWRPSASTRAPSATSAGPARRRRRARQRRRRGGGAAGARAGGDERRLQPALLAGELRRAEHPRRAALRPAGRRRRGGRRQRWSPATRR